MEQWCGGANQWSSLDTCESMEQFGAVDERDNLEQKISAVVVWWCGGCLEKKFLLEEVLIDQSERGRG
jgi:hypothetical protein